MVLFAIIIVVFAISFGAPMDGCQQTSGPRRAATVAGHDIMTDEVRIVYNRYGGRNERNQSEEQLAQEKSKALKALILLHLLADRARDIGLRVGEDELLEYIKDPLRNAELASVLGGRTGIYQRYVLNQLRVSEQRYQEYKANELLARKYLDLAEMQIGVLPGEIDAIKQLRETKVNLEYVKLAPATLTSRVEPTEDELEAYVTEHADEIKEAYEANKKEYSEPAKMRIRRVYISKPSGASEADLAKKKEAFEAAKARVLEGGEDFGEVAGEVSEDFAKDKNGLMDWTAQENIDQDIVQALEGKDIGAVEELETDFAYMLVKLEGRKPAKVTPLEEVEQELATELLAQERVDELVDEMAAELKAKVAETGSLKEAVAALKKQAAEEAQDDEATEGDDSGGEAPTPDEIEEGDVGDAGQEAAPGATASPWEAVRVSETGLFNLEGQDLSAMFGGQLPPGVSLGRGAWDRIPGIGQSAELAKDAFALTEDQPMAPKVYDVNGAKVLARLKERAEPKTDEEADTGEELGMYGEARGKRMQSLMGQWQTLFIRPSDDYGPWLEQMYEDAITSGRVTFNADDVKMAEVLRDDSPLATASSPAGGAAAEAPQKDDAPADEAAAADGEDAPAKK